MDKCLLVIELYSYNSTSPSKRAIIDMTRYENFARLFNQMQMVQSQPTNFQIQLAFLSLSHNDLKDVFSELISIERPE